MASEDGVLTAKELVRLGVPERTAYRRTQEDGPWTLLLPATFLLANGTPTRRQWEIGALRHAGPGAMLTGLGGARRHGIRRGRDPEWIHVLIPEARQVLSVKAVVIERTRRLPRPLIRDGLPVAPLARCLIDHVRRVKDTEVIAALLTEAVQRRMVLVEELCAELDLASRKGTAAPRRVLEVVKAGVRSAAEFEAHAFWRSATALPPIEWNVTVYDEHGSEVATVDGLLRELGVVVEIDSVEYHFATPEQVRRTAERRRRLEAMGFVVVSIRPSQLRDDQAGVLTDLLHWIDVARGMPAPRATYEPRAARR